jgi:tetratricopeptide (TPR) repeat protein
MTFRVNMDKTKIRIFFTKSKRSIICAMSEQTENSQPIQPIKEDDTQPIKPIRKKSRWLSILLSVLGFILLIGLGGYGGYTSGIGDRKAVEGSTVTKQLSEQFSFALVDIQFKRYDAATQRLEYIISKNPNYPGAQQKLTEVLVLSVIPTPTPVPTLTSTPDFSGAESAYQRAQQLIQAQDWSNALAALDSIRKLDPTYKTAQVDGMYYFALRNQGYTLITKVGNLEGGIYYLTLAERFGPLDNTAVQLRDGARMYITGASFWELDWKQAYDYFSQVDGSLWDGTMTGTQRLQFASMSYGDELYDQQNYCKADEMYQISEGLGKLNEKSTGHAYQAHLQCYPPTATAEVAPVIADTPTP